MAYFECISGGAGGGATITVTYDSSFYNKTITCSNGTKTYTKTTTSSGSTEFSVSDEGTWTITCNGVSVSLDVTLNYATQMKPTGSTATPVNDIQTWLKCGGIFDKSYTTINQVLADTTTLLALISDSNAVDYMVRSTTWASDVCADSTAMTDIGANDYCADTLLSDATWASAIVNSTYLESVLNVKVPTMTSNTTPSGVASYTGNLYASSYDAYKAFDGSEDRLSLWIASNNGTLMYEFASTMVLKAVRIVPNKYTTFVGKATTMYIDGYDGNDWVNLLEQSLSASDIAQESTFSIVNTTDYSKFRLRYDNGSVTYNGTNYCSCTALQLYGRTTTT